ncbi:MAG: TlpA disulfide reductase family protein [Actinomycetota bacterium]
MATTGKPNRTNEAQTSAGSGSSPLFILAVVAVIVLGLAALAIVATSGGDDTEAAEDTSIGADAGAAEDEAAETAAVTVDGDAIAAMERGVQVIDTAGQGGVGMIAPTLTGTSFDGSDVSIGADGRPKVVYFLAHWCPHCQREVPAVMDLIEAGSQPEGLDIYAVSTAVDDEAPNYPPSDWLAGEGVTFPVLRDDAASSALAAYGPSGFPYAVYLDGDNRVIAQSAGELDAATTEQLWIATAAG